MEISEELNRKDHFFLDLDNTVWDWDSLKPGAEELVHRLRQSDKQVKFHTDNTLMSREGYADKLSSMGIEAEKTDVFTVGYALARHLSENMVSKAYVVGETGLMEELERNGIEITEEAETVIFGYDRQFNYSKARKALETVENGGRVYLCSTEKYFQSSMTKKPHQGLFNRIFDDFDRTEIAGKPGELFVEQFKNYFDYNRTNSIFIGDRLADIETGKKLGMTTGGFIGGNLSKKKLRKAEKRQKPDFGVDNLQKLRRRIL